MAVESTEQMAPSLTQDQIDQRVFDLYDEYCHGSMVMAQALLPRYATAQTISFTDERIKARYVTYPSPDGTSGTAARQSVPQ